MKSELKHLESPENYSLWKDKINTIKPKLKSQEKKIKELESENILSNNPEKVDHLDVDAKVDYNKLNAQEVMDRGDKILEADDNAIKNMAYVVYDDVDQMKNVYRE